MRKVIEAKVRQLDGAEKYFVSPIRQKKAMPPPGRVPSQAERLLKEAIKIIEETGSAAIDVSWEPGRYHNDESKLLSSIMQSARVLKTRGELGFNIGYRKVDPAAGDDVSSERKFTTLYFFKR